MIPVLPSTPKNMRNFLLEKKSEIKLRIANEEEALKNIENLLEEIDGFPSLSEGKRRLKQFLLSNGYDKKFENRKENVEITFTRQDIVKFLRESGYLKENHSQKEKDSIIADVFGDHHIKSKYFDYIQKEDGSKKSGVRKLIINPLNIK